MSEFTGMGNSYMPYEERKLLERTNEIEKLMRDMEAKINEQQAKLTRYKAALEYAKELIGGEHAEYHRTMTDRIAAGEVIFKDGDAPGMY